MWATRSNDVDAKKGVISHFWTREKPQPLHLSGGAELTGASWRGGEGEICSIIVLWFSLTPAYKPPLVLSGHHLISGTRHDIPPLGVYVFNLISIP